MTRAYQQLMWQLKCPELKLASVVNKYNQTVITNYYHEAVHQKFDHKLMYYKNLKKCLCSRFRLI